MCRIHKLRLRLQVLVRCLLCEVRAAPLLLVGIMTSPPVRARRSRTVVVVATQTTSGRRSRVCATVALWWTRSSIRHVCGTYVSLVFYAELRRSVKYAPDLRQQ